jgi:hypothetical protein
VKEEIEVTDVAPVVEIGDQPFILFGRRLHLEPMNLAVVGGADELRPI